jgi:hypothetical protein
MVAPVIWRMARVAYREDTRKVPRGQAAGIFARTHAPGEASVDPGADIRRDDLLVEIAEEVVKSPG